MADFFVRHGLNPDKLVRFSVTITQVHDTQHDPPEELLTDYPRVEGDEVWILEIGTYELDTNGDEIPTRKIHLTTLSDVDSEIQTVVEDMCQLIDWEPLRDDAQAPYVYWYLPNDGNIVEGESAEVFDVPITVDVYIKIRDSLPAVGIDYSSVDVKLEVYTPETAEFDITSEVELTGSPYDLQLYWHPPVRVWDEYGG
jgi:deoxycytidine triphosphate deaminase